MGGRKGRLSPMLSVLWSTKMRKGGVSVGSMWVDKLGVYDPGRLDQNSISFNAKVMI